MLHSHFSSSFIQATPDLKGFAAVILESTVCRNNWLLHIYFNIHNVVDVCMRSCKLTFCYNLFSSVSQLLLAALLILWWGNLFITLYISFFFFFFLVIIDEYFKIYDVQFNDKLMNSFGVKLKQNKGMKHKVSPKIHIFTHYIVL